MARKVRRHAVIALVALCGAALPFAGAAHASPSSLIAGATSTSIASDSQTGVNAIVRNVDGTIYDGAPLQVTFSSNCASAGLARLGSSAETIHGIASVTYQPSGCAGLDQVTATVAGSPGLVSAVSIYVTSQKSLSTRGLVGRSIFFDTSLSASGTMSCASCHAPANNYHAPTTTQTPLGGASAQAVGFRAAPTASYMAFMPPFRWLKPGTRGTVGRLGTPHAGLMWDGRAPTLADQARGPFTEPHEMANANNRSVMNKMLARPYLAAFVNAYGRISPSSNPDVIVARMADAVAIFEREDLSFRPFTSKYDRAQAGQASLTPQEQNGQALFFDPTRGGCAGCHSSVGAKQAASVPQFFSDQSYRAIGVPRNWNLPYNKDSLALQALSDLGRSWLANGAAAGAPHAYYDLGVCGPFRRDSVLDPGLCGMFRVPILRNVALKHSYEHNGVFGTLFEVVNFYNNREANPSQIYLTQSGAADAKYNDLPVQFQGNIEQRAPFRPLPTGQPRLSQQDVRDIVAFMCTLTDGYDVNRPEAYNMPAQCRAVQR